MVLCMKWTVCNATGFFSSINQCGWNFSKRVNSDIIIINPLSENR